jgi:hypothetical protein
MVVIDGAGFIWKSTYEEVDRLEVTLFVTTSDALP